MRSVQFFTSRYYHVYNRGVDKRKIFLRFGHYRRFLSTIRSILNTGSATPRPLYNQGLALKSKVNILAYCCMPNHYHFLVQQTADHGITEFMHRLNTSYTMYFNLNQKRTGRLFEYTFKAKAIENEELLLHITRYIHLNPVIARLVPSFDLWPWSSYLETVGKRLETFCTFQLIHAFFGNEQPSKKYEAFVNDQTAYAQLLHDIENTKDEDVLFL